MLITARAATGADFAPLAPYLNQRMVWCLISYLQAIYEGYENPLISEIATSVYPTDAELKRWPYLDRLGKRPPNMADAKAVNGSCICRSRAGL